MLAKENNTVDIIAELEKKILPPLHLNIIDFNKTLHSLDEDSLLFIDYLDPLLSSNRKALMDTLVTRYSGDTLSVIPKCECESLSGANKIGRICEICFTPVVQSTQREIKSTVWMRAPEGTAGFLNPAMYLILVKLFGGKSSIVHGKNSVNIIDWLLRMPVKNKVKALYATNPLIQKYVNLGFKQGLNNFYNQLDMFIEHAFTPKLYGTTSDQKSKERREIAKQWLINNKHKLFVKAIPLPSKITFVREDVEKTGYVDKNVQLCIDAVNTMLNIKLAESKVNKEDNIALSRLKRLREDRTALATAQIAKFYFDYVSKTLSKKSGTLRKHVYGIRSNFTFRAVITSNFAPFEIIDGKKVWHHYQDVHLPWSVGVNIFSLYITNKLLKFGFTPIEANKFITEHVNVYHPLLDDMMKLIIKEHPAGKQPILLNRNPTLPLQSIQLLYITKIKDDPAIRSMSISLLVLKGFGADFDGDELNGLLLTDLNTYEMAKKGLHPANGVLHQHVPKKISNIVQLPTPTVTTMAHWFNEPLKRKNKSGYIK